MNVSQSTVDFSDHAILVLPANNLGNESSRANVESQKTPSAGKFGRSS